MRGEEGKIAQEFSFNGDTWQLAYNFRNLLNGVDFLTDPKHQDAPKNSDADLLELISWMMTEDRHKRPQMREVSAKLNEMKVENEKREKLEEKEAHKPEMKDVIDERDADRFSQVYAKLPPLVEQPVEDSFCQLV